MAKDSVSDEVIIGQIKVTRSYFQLTAEANLYVPVSLNSLSRLRAARGMIFLKEMELQEFFRKVRELRKITESGVDGD